MVVVGWYWVRMVVMRGRYRRPINRGWDWRRGHGHCLMIWRLWYIWMMDETSVLLGEVAHPLHKTKLMATCANSWGTLPNRYARCFFKKLWNANYYSFYYSFLVILFWNMVPKRYRYTHNNWTLLMPLSKTWVCWRVYLLWRRFHCRMLKNIRQWWRVRRMEV